MPQPRSLVLPLLDWFAAHARDLPWRPTRDPYAIWVSEIMLQQTQVKTVIPYWERWLRELPDVRALAAAPESRVLKLWEGLGYYTRARHLQRAARQLVVSHDGRFPESFEAVLALPGVGRYTAGAICSIAFNQPHPVLDGNVIRVLSRVFALKGNPRERAASAALWRLAEELVLAAAETGRPDACSHLNQALMELGALVCTPRQPDCPSCPWRRACRARREGIVDQLPVRPPRPAPTPRHFFVFVAWRRGRCLVRQRPAGAVNAGLWEFPTVEAIPEASPAAVAREHLRLAAAAGLEASRLGTVRCSVTRYRVTLEAFTIRLPQGVSSRDAARAIGARWLPFAELARLALSSGQRRVYQLARNQFRFAAPPSSLAGTARSKPSGRNHRRCQRSAGPSFLGSARAK